MFTLAQLICACIASLTIGVMFHAAIASWYDRVKDNAVAKLKEEIAELRAKL